MAKKNVIDHSFEGKNAWAEKVGLYDLFNEGLDGMSWDDWTSMGSIDKEEILNDALIDLKVDCPYSKDELYDIFWGWAHGLGPDDFWDESDDDDDWNNDDDNDDWPDWDDDDD